MKSKLPQGNNQQWDNNSQNRRAEGPDPISQSEYYDGIVSKRIIAYIIDMIVIFVLSAIAWVAAWIVGIATFGLLLAPLLGLLFVVPFAYHTIMVAGRRAATFGMQFVGIRVYRLDGGRPETIQAFVQTVIFYLTAPGTSFLILLISFFNPKRRCLHDYLAGTLVLNDHDKFE